MSLTKIGSIGINTGIAFAGVTTIVTLNTANDALSIGATVNVGSGITLGASGDIFATGVSTVTTLKVGSGVTVSSDGDVFATGVTTSTTFSGAFSGSGANITALNASNIASGTVPTARLGSGTASSSTFLRGDSTFQTVNTDLVSDTSPQLGGDLASNGNDIVFADNDKAIFGTGSDFKIYHNGTDNYIMASNGHIRFDTGSAELARITSDGKLLIGTTTEGEASADDLTIGGSGNQGITIRSGTSNYGLLYFSDATSGSAEYAGAIEYKHSDNFMVFRTDATERLRIDSSGRMGLGTVLQSDAGSAGAGFKIETYLQRNNIYAFPDGYYAASLGEVNNTQTKVWAAVDSHYNRTSAVSAGLFLSAFHADAGGSGCGSAIKNLKSGNALTFSTVTTGASVGTVAVETERLRIDSSGRMCLGTTDATIADSGADDFVISRAGHAGITIDATSSTNSSVFFADGPTGNEAYRGFVQYSHSSDTLKLGASGADQLEISSGNVEITDGDLVMGTSGHGISFAATSQASGSTSELFDDYEEGTYTPTDASGAGLSLTNNTTARYTKIGRMVYVQFDITWPSTSNGNTAGFTMPITMSLSYGTGVIGWTDNGKPLFIHVGGQIYVMDNNNSIGNSSQHTLNSEISGKRLIGNVWYIG